MIRYDASVYISVTNRLVGIHQVICIITYTGSPGWKSILHCDSFVAKGLVTLGNVQQLAS